MTEPSDHFNTNDWYRATLGAYVCPVCATLKSTASEFKRHYQFHVDDIYCPRFITTVQIEELQKWFDRPTPTDDDFPLHRFHALLALGELDCYPENTLAILDKDLEGGLGNG